MKVKELIELLSKLDGEKEIRTQSTDCESGTATVLITKIKDFKEYGENYFIDYDQKDNNCYVIE